MQERKNKEAKMVNRSRKQRHTKAIGSKRAATKKKQVIKDSKVKRQSEK